MESVIRIMPNWDDMNLDFEKVNSDTSFFSSEGNLHTYPAKAMPNMVNTIMNKLLNEYSIKSVLDPFVGSGTTALESKYIGLDFWGSDLNPLSILLTKTKVLTIDNTTYVKNKISKFLFDLENNEKSQKIVSLHSFQNIDYWFKEVNIKQLSFIRKEIDVFLASTKKEQEIYALILFTSFSSTVRQSSLSRNGEFKLYRMSPYDIERFSVNSIEVFSNNVKSLLNMLVEVSSIYKNKALSNVYLKNAKNIDYLKDETIDLIITSPPYGDSQSTVAYGQFSRLPLQWMGDLVEKYLKIDCSICNCDNYLLGGKESINENVILDNSFSSNVLADLTKQMDDSIELQSKIFNEAKQELEFIKKQLENYILIDNISIKNQELRNLIEERIRLVIYKKINTQRLTLTRKQIKDITFEQRDLFINQLNSTCLKLRYKRRTQLLNELLSVKNSINRKLEYTPKRKKEVIDFFKDMFVVVKECDRVLAKNGLQAWIVGHRTVLGEITVNMEGILSDWFENLGYTVITSLRRKYSFKRMPNHINSTLSRKDEVKTMMNEYILIVKKWG